MKRIVILFILLLACSTARASFDDSILKASTDITFEVLLRGDDDGMGETGETSATVTCYYMRQGAAAAVEVTMAEGILGTHADGGWLAVDATNMPGLYQFHSPDGAFATGANAVTFMFTASGVIDKTVKFALVNYDPRDAVRLGLTALPNANADAAGGLIISDAGGLAADTILTSTTWTDARAGYLDELAAANIPSDVDAILTDTAAVDTTTEMRTFLTGGDNPVSTLTTAQVNTEADTALSDIKLDHLVAVADADDPVDNSIIAKLVSADYGTADWSDFDWTTDSLEAIRNRGDLAWKTGAGSGATESYTEDTNWTRTVGDNDGGTAADTLTVNGTTFDTGEVSGGTYLEVDVTVDITAGEYGTTVFMWGFYSGGGAHYIRVMAYNYTDSLYEDIGVIGLGTTVQVYEYAMTPDHTDTAAGEIKLKFLHAGGSGVASHVLSIDKMQVNTITEIVNDGSGLTAIPWNPSWDAEAQSEAADALTAYDPPTNAEMEARTLVAADYFLFGSDTVANVSTVATLTGHTAQTGDSYTRIGAPAGASVSADVAAIKAETATIVADTGELQTNQGAWATAIGFSTHTAADVWAVVARTLTSGAAPSAGDVADAVWDEANADHLVAGSTGAKLNSAAAAGDPLSSAVPAAYASGTAGYAIGTYLDAKISNISIAGTGTETFTYTLTSDADATPIVGATVWVSSDSVGATVLASGMTNSSGEVTFFLNSGTIYIWRNKTGFSFTNPDTEVIP